MSNEWYEARGEAGDELIRERARELEECGDCESCDKVDAIDVYKEVLDKIDKMIEHKKEIQQKYLDDVERSDKYLRHSLLQEQIRALKELREVLW